MCLDDQILNTYLDGELVEPWKSQVEDHLSYCKACSNRLGTLSELSKDIRNAGLGDDVIKKHQNHVLQYMENNYLNGEKKSSFFRKQFRFSFSQFIGVAAAFVIVFVGSLALTSGKSNKIDAPQIKVLDLQNVSPVSYKSLDSYSSEELLKNLRSRGLIVTVQSAD